MRIFGRPRAAPPQQTSPPTSTSQSSREHQADAELEALIKEFRGVEGKAIDSLENTAVPAQDHKEPKQHERMLPDGGLDISPSVMYPRTMSCRQQFDQAYYCQSLGGKFNDLYRYGGIRSCSEQWGAFWFCMRNRTLSEKAKEEEVREFYRERDERRKKEWGSSEDIWEIRTRAVDRAFWKDPDKVEEKS